MFDPNDRRYRYPFINCTNCGPRFSIIQDIPYDRPKTTMSGFKMCPECQAEYEDPTNRRFHAQPIACSVCGPRIWFEPKGNEPHVLLEQGLKMARMALKQGKILAIKGLGGYHLACDASNPQAVAELRKRKKRSDKPFALMVFDRAALERHCSVTPQEVELAETRQRPIVLFERRPESPIVEQVAPGQHTLGIMLPYTPLHLLLLEPEPGFPDVLVMTSGNLSEEPIAYTDDDARQRLSPLADAFLMHDRPIHMRVDDSVQRISADSPTLLRRSRGFAPDPIQLHHALPQVLGTGAELKNTFSLTRQKYAFVSHHIGDLENFETLQSFEQGISHYERLFKIQPEVIGCDLHPDYLASRYAQSRAEREDIPLVRVQHHHAHLAACLAENGRPFDEPAIGLSFDGTGYGTDGAVWGGDVLVGDCRAFERPFHLAYTPLPGGDSAVRQPSRMALAHLWRAGIDWEPDLPAVLDQTAQEQLVLRQQLERGLNAPPTSSLGRLFDAVSSLLGIRQRATYEGQAAMELEACADPQEQAFYPFIVANGVFDPAPVLTGLLQDWRRGITIPQLSARFHNSLLELILEICVTLREWRGISTVALSGGVWQNRFLFEHALTRLVGAGFTPLIHHQLPPNDGCICLGQAVIAASTIINGPTHR
jgi:hydrogenase maturation protein HypF